MKKLLLFTIVFIFVLSAVWGAIHFVDPLFSWDSLDKMQQRYLLFDSLCATFIIYKFITFKDEYDDGEGD